MFFTLSFRHLSDDINNKNIFAGSLTFKIIYLIIFEHGNILFFKKKGQFGMNISKTFLSLVDDEYRIRLVGIGKMSISGLWSDNYDDKVERNALDRLFQLKRYWLCSSYIYSFLKKKKKSLCPPYNGSKCGNRRKKGVD